VQSLAPPARLGPALDAALDILLHGALKSDAEQGRELEHYRLSDDLFGCWPAKVDRMACAAQLDLDNLTDFLVNAVPQPVYEVLMMVLAQGFERYFARDQDLNPVEVLELFTIYNMAQGPRSCIIAALARHLSAATPPNDTTPLQFPMTYVDNAEFYWDLFDYSDWKPAAETLTGLQSFLGADATALGNTVRQRVTDLTMPDGVEEGYNNDLECSDSSHALKCMHAREQRLLEDPLQHHAELVLLRARLIDCKSLIGDRAQRNNSDVVLREAHEMGYRCALRGPTT
jgi:hypothetical protein